MPSPNPPAKRSAEHDSTASPSDGQTAKAQRASLDETAPPSSSSRRRNNGGEKASSRTGQACDRCKTRKIRCDDTEGGCVPCRQSNSQCVTTDRITQRATARGHTEAVERERDAARQHIAALEEQLRALGQVPRLQNPYYDDAYPPDADLNTNIRTGFPAQQDTLLSQPIGSSLSVFGMKIDLARFAHPLEKHQDSATSIEAFHESLFRTSRDPSPWGSAELPATQTECMHFAEQYVYGINPWLPSLHPPELFALVSRVYDSPSYQPTSTETATLHMVLANIKYQMGMRNRSSGQSRILLKEAFAHYHHALGHFQDLTRSRSLPDLQALCLFCIMTRCFPSASTAWLVTQFTLMCIVEVGLHRSLKVWPEEFARSTIVTVQLRKCVFWSIYVIHVTVATKLGRPLALRAEDIDIEHLGADETSSSTDASQDPDNGVSFRAASYMYKLGQLHGDMHSTMYGVRPSGNYVRQLYDFEARLDKWRSSLPPSFVHGTPESTETHNRPFASWMLYCASDLDLALHHPAVCRTKSPEILSSNLTACITAASAIIRGTVALRSTRSVDTTWMNVVTLTSALFTSLFAYWERRDSLTTSDVRTLRYETDVGLDVLSESGETLRAGPDLRASVQGIMDKWIADITSFVNDKASKAACAPKAVQEARSSNIFETKYKPEAQPAYQQVASEAQKAPAVNSRSSQPLLSADFAGQPQANGQADMAPRYAQSYGSQFANAFAASGGLANGTHHLQSAAPEASVLYADGAASTHPQHPVSSFGGGSANNWQTFAEMTAGSGSAGYMAHPQPQPQQQQRHAIDATGAGNLLAMNGMSSEHHAAAVAAAQAAAAQATMLPTSASIGPDGHAGLIGLMQLPVETQPWPASIGYGVTRQMPTATTSLTSGGGGGVMSAGEGQQPPQSSIPQPQPNSAEQEPQMPQQTLQQQPQQQAKPQVPQTAQP